MKTVLWAGTLANGFYPVNPTPFVKPDALILVVAPAIGGRDPMLALAPGQHRGMRLLCCREIGAVLAWLHDAFLRD